MPFQKIEAEKLSQAVVRQIEAETGAEPAQAAESEDWKALFIAVLHGPLAWMPL